MGKLGKGHKIIPITWACPMFPLVNFTVAFVGEFQIPEVDFALILEKKI